MAPLLFAQTDSVDVTFYYKSAGAPAAVFLPGEFNNWGPNSSGNIAANAPSKMNYEPFSGQWVKTVRLRVGGQPGGGVPGAYQYKINENGVNTGWRPDPLNPRKNSRDNDNSILYVRNPTIHYLLPNSLSPIVRTRQPLIEAYLFPATRTRIDTNSIIVKLDNFEYRYIGAGYNEATQKFSFIPSTPLTNGAHQLIVIARTLAGTINSDTTRFSVQADAVQILTQPAETWKANWPLRGEILKTNGTPDSTLRSATLWRGTAAFPVTMRNGKFDTTLALLEGDNLFSVQARVGGVLQTSSSVTIKRKVNHNPNAVIAFDTSATQIKLRAAQSTDPDGQTLTFSWQEDATNPQTLGVNNAADSVLTVTRPKAPGEYYFTLTARDPNGNVDRTRQFFTVTPNGQIIPATLKSNPAWVREGRIYIVFFKGLTPAGTIKAALPHLEVIKALGFSIIWVLPVMDNASPINNSIGPGYEIVDFYNVAPEYGTNQDFKDFVARAHQLGLKVILDFTPNHSGRTHPLAEHARQYGIHSPYWPYYQHANIQHNTNGLGIAVDAFGFYYYSGFSDRLLNWDWSDLDARLYMLDVLKHWLTEYGLDGYRLDVYWGPHRRYGSENFDRPLRSALKRLKPEILLLGEDDGTGVGTELIYGDLNGGVDAAYDFKLFFNQIRGFGFSATSANNLHNEWLNGEYYPGLNSHYFRFMETQDEDRIAYVYNSFEKTMPMAAVLFTAPGIPGIMQGQEVGYGLGISGSKENRVRTVVNFNFTGRGLLLPHYQKIVQVRAQFPAFRQHKQDTNRDGLVNGNDEPDFIRVATTDGQVYAFARPYLDHNGLTVVNFSASAKTVTMDLTRPGVLKFTGGIAGATAYFLNDLYNDTHLTTPGANLNAVQITLPPYGTSLLVISTGRESLILPPLTGVAESGPAALPQTLALQQNFPNPFNPETAIRFELPRAAAVKLRVFNLLGAEVLTLLNERLPAGTHTFRWDGKNTHQQPVGSGVYLLRLEAGDEVMVRKMVVVR